jgi:beta-phosphoglucomutase-like phosphatase (HAD superfamily)
MVKKAPKPIAGIERLIKTFHNMGLKQAIASSSSHEFIQAAIEGLGYRQYFNELISGFHLPPKPQPHVFLKAAEAINCSPSECLVIEDSPMGVAGAKAAGMKCIGITTTRSPEALKQADLIIENTLNPPLDKIITLINSTNLKEQLNNLQTTL